MSLELDLLELFRKAFLLSALVALLLIDLFIDLLKTFVFGSFDFGFVLLFFQDLLVPLGFVLLTAHLARLLDLGRLIHKLLDFLLLSLQVVFSLGNDLLLS